MLDNDNYDLDDPYSEQPVFDCNAVRHWLPAFTCCNHCHNHQDHKEQSTWITIGGMYYYLCCKAVAAYYSIKEQFDDK